jgi:hypothetical protein
MDKFHGEITIELDIVDDVTQDQLVVCGTAVAKLYQRHWPYAIWKPDVKGPPQATSTSADLFRYRRGPFFSIFVPNDSLHGQKDDRSYTVEIYRWQRTAEFWVDLLSGDTRNMPPSSPEPGDDAYARPGALVHQRFELA